MSHISLKFTASISIHARDLRGLLLNTLSEKSQKSLIQILSEKYSRGCEGYNADPKQREQKREVVHEALALQIDPPYRLNAVIKRIKVGDYLKPVRHGLNRSKQAGDHDRWQNNQKGDDN